ncbi:metallophosphoesterase [Povalibacter sp.]|uniref:metallophosphoesterase n=1 Tax=Povalibacter sp. TaxID=1962978 RepID=UPI002F3FCFA5
MRSVIAVLPLLAAGALATPLDDGPYVARQADGSGLTRSISGEAVKEGRIAIGQAFTVGAVGAMPAFEVQLRPVETPARDEIRLNANTPMFVVADTHGEYEILGELLRKQRIVDTSLRWSFGKGHVVFLGDVFDRGPHQIEILWLIYELQRQASRAGGGVHLLIGNHEAMVMRGDLRYLNPKYQATARTLGAPSYVDLVAADTVLGQWLRSRPAVLKIRDLLCLHGGISPQLVERGLTVSQINATVREALSGEESPQIDWLMGPLGPLWYRGYFADAQGEASATTADIDAMLRHFGVTKIIVGHTRVPTVTSLYDGKVVAVQVYPHRDAASAQSVMEALRIEGRVVKRATIAGALEPL